MTKQMYFNSLQFPGLNEPETPLIAPNTALSRQPATSDPGKHVGIELGLSLCVMMGSSTRVSLGDNEGASDRSSVGSFLGDTEEVIGEGRFLGLFLLLVGRGVGRNVGGRDGNAEGRYVGVLVGIFDLFARLVGRSVGDKEGVLVGDLVGFVVG